jgi:hypothetical protein
MPEPFCAAARSSARSCAIRDGPRSPRAAGQGCRTTATRWERSAAFITRAAGRLRRSGRARARLPAISSSVSSWGGPRTAVMLTTLHVTTQEYKWMYDFALLSKQLQDVGFVIDPGASLVRRASSAVNLDLARFASRSALNGASSSAVPRGQVRCGNLASARAGRSSALMEPRRSPAPGATATSCEPSRRLALEV